MRMKMMVEELYQDRKRSETGGPSHVEGKKEVGGEEPPKSPPSSPTYVYSSSSLHSPFGKQKGKIDLNVPQLKLDIMFELPMYNGELKDEQLENWIHQIEVYCRIQNFTEDNIKIQLDSLRLRGTTLI